MKDDETKEMEAALICTMKTVASRYFGMIGVYDDVMTLCFVDAFCCLNVLLMWTDNDCNVGIIWPLLFN